MDCVGLPVEYGSVLRSFRETTTSRAKAAHNHRLVFEPLEPRLVLEAGPLVISELMAVNNSTLADEDGQFPDWIEIYNPTYDAVQLGDWYLTDEAENLTKWRLPDVPLAGRDYLVPESDDQSAATSWTAAGFDDSTWNEFRPPPRVLITEAGTVADFAEIENLSDRPVDTMGWVVAANNSIGREPDINEVHSTLWPLPDSIQPGDVLYRHDDPDEDPNDATYHDAFWCELISWKTTGPGWVMIVDDVGNVVDLVVWGYSDTFSVENGLWADVLLRGREAEFPVSFEVIDAADHFYLQQDAGIRLQGSSYRRRTIGPNASAKWSFKIYFRDQYDDHDWLDYRLIERSSADRYKSITLRGGYNDSSNPFIKDELGRRLQKDLGSVAAEGTFANVFINGRLKNNGYYNPSERHEEHTFQEKYGSDLEWDVVTKWQPSGTPADPPRSHSEPYYFDVRDGDEVHFGELLDYVSSNDMSQEVHYGEVSARLDTAQFIDYLILQGYARIQDWPQNNWNAARERSDGELGKWRFYAWDLEFGWGSSQLTASFKTPGSSSTMSLSILYEALVDSAEFRQLFADRAGKHFYNGGALAEANVRVRFEELRQEMLGVLPGMNTYIRDTFAPQRPGYVLNSARTLDGGTWSALTVRASACSAATTGN